MAKPKKRRRAVTPPKNGAKIYAGKKAGTTAKLPPRRKPPSGAAEDLLGASMNLSELLDPKQYQELVQSLLGRTNELKEEWKREQEQYEKEGLFFVRDYNALPETSIMLVDIDGTITSASGGGHIPAQVAWQLARLAASGIYICFITGRDIGWLLQYGIAPFLCFFRYPAIRNQLRFFGESGCLRLVLEEGGAISCKVPRVLQGHPLLEKENRDKLAALCYNPHNSTWCQPDASTPLDMVKFYGAVNKDAYLIDINASADERPPLDKYHWSPYKIIIGTAEKNRIRPGVPETFIQESYVRRLVKEIKELKLAKKAAVQEISTALNIVPVVHNQPLGKSWAAGVALSEIYRNEFNGEVPWNVLLARTLVFGDGKADLEFTNPAIPDPEAQQALRKRPPQMVFVGNAAEDLPKDTSDPLWPLRDNIVIQATGNREIIGAPPGKREAIRWADPFGASVFTAVVDWLHLNQMFRPFIVR